MEASKVTQIVVTSHSPDLLNREDIPKRPLRAVVMDQGATIIGDIDEVGRTALRERLYTVWRSSWDGPTTPRSHPRWCRHFQIERTHPVAIPKSKHAKNRKFG